MLDERVQVPARVGDEPDAQAVLAQLGEHGQRVLVELEVGRAEPAVGDRPRDLLGARAVTAHAAHDVRREPHPDLLVVLELRVVLEVFDRRRAGLRVELGVERQAVARAGLAVALGPEERAGLGEREVDVEEDRLDPTRAFYTSAGHVYAAGWRLASEGRLRRIRSMCARSSSAEMTASSSGACARTTPHGSTMELRP